MATAQELKNDARELLARAEKALAEGDQQAYETLWAEFAKKDAEQQEQHKREEALKAAFEQYGNPVHDLRREEDALIRPVPPDVAKAGVMVNGQEVIAYADRNTEGYIKGFPAAVQHPGIIKRYGPELREEAEFYSNAFMKWLRKGPQFLEAKELKALQEGTDSEGGYLVPTDQVKLPFVHDPGAPGSTIRPLSSNFTTTRDAGDWPTVGSVVWAATAEEAAIPATTDPVFGQVTFAIKKIMGSHKVSTELLEDSAVDIGSIINLLYTESLGRYEDQQAIEGDGTTEPQGIRTSGGVDSSGAGLIDASDGWDAGNIFNIWAQLGAQFRNGAVWHTTSTTMGRILSINNATTGGIHFIQNPAVGSPTMTIMGYPVSMFDGTGWDTTLSGTNEYGCFGNFRLGYYFINRVGMSIKRLNELYAGNDQVGLVARVRYDSRVALNSAFLIMKGEA